MTSPCRLDPASWDIEMPAGGKGEYVRRVAGRAVRACYSCVERRACLTDALADPPSHPCILGGVVWDRKPRQRYGAIRPFRFDDWAPHLRSEQTKPAPAASCPSPLGYLQHLARGERGVECGCAGFATRSRAVPEAVPV